MNKNKLKNIIELVVRKEVKKQLSEIFINEQTEEVKLSEVISTPKQKAKKRIVKKKQYSKNPALNEVLNNTNPLGKSQQDEYPSLGGGVLGSDNMAEVLGYGNLGGVQNKERAREGVQDALTRDYSGLMKAINKKKEGHRP